MGFNLKKLGRKIDRAVGGKKGWAALAANIPGIGGVASGALTAADMIEEEARKRGVSKETVIKEKAEAAKQVVQTAQDTAAAGRLAKKALPTAAIVAGVAVVVILVLRK